jgi:hypothetical protein
MAAGGSGDLDFWIGRWDATWDDGSGTTARGTNTVTREVSGHAVLERFEVGPPEPFSGMSISWFDGAAGRWRQTWVDSAGSSWTFVGGRQADGTVHFATPERVDDEQVFKRMVFSGFEGDAFDWRWEASADGVLWSPRWTIRYTRQEPGAA